MTREEVMRLTGRELDWLVHKNVVGASTEWHEAENPSQGKGLCHICVPLYSSDMSAAWQVVQRLIDTGYEFELSFDRHYEPEPWYAMFFLPPDRFHSARSAWAATAAEAICRAALLTVQNQACGETECREANKHEGD